MQRGASLDVKNARVHGGAPHVVGEGSGSSLRMSNCAEVLPQPDQFSTPVGERVRLSYDDRRAGLDPLRVNDRTGPLSTQPKEPAASAC